MNELNPESLELLWKSLKKQQEGVDIVIEPDDLRIKI